MGTLPDPSVGAERSADSVFGIVERVARNLDARDLDRIDCEFLWLWCHGDVVPIIEELRAIEASDRVRYRDDYKPDRLGFTRDAPSIEERAGTWWPFVDEESSQTHTHYLDLRRRAKATVPAAVVGDLLAGRPITLRPMQASLNMRTFKDGTEAWFVLIVVHSGTATGRNVEDAIETVVEDFDLQRDDWAGARFHRTNAEYLIVTGFGEFRALFRFTVAQPASLPCVAVLAPLPLCSAGAVGREYDAVVRSGHQWHLRLPGAGATRRDKEVALRTWGVGLLLGLGQRFGPAMRRVCEAGRLAEVSQDRFGVDRKGLIGRVPEAAPFLMQRPRPGEGLQTA